MSSCNSSCNDAKFYWVPTSRGRIPDKAVIAGQEYDGKTMYVGRIVKHNDIIIPAKITTLPNYDRAYAGLDGTEIMDDNFEVLCGEGVAWTPFRNHIPHKAIVGGKLLKDCEHKLYIGRVPHKGDLIPGSINSDTNTLSVAYLGTEVQYTDGYEILIEV